jgi:hypothetical protein
MDGLREFLEQLKQQGTAQGRFRGLLHILIGRRLEKTDGTLISPGVTWREAARLLKRVRWDKDAVQEIGLTAAALAARDRERYWYMAITQAQVDGPAAISEAEQLSQSLQALGYQVSPGPKA